MFRLFALVLALSAVAYGEVRESDVLTSRIIGGVDAEISEVPWHVSLRRSDVYFCAASLISSVWAVSAAHCTTNRIVSQLTVRAGSNNRLSGGQIRQVVELINHPEYDPLTIDNDISLLRVAVAFTLSANLRVVSLPYQGEFVRPGAYGVVSGWGTLSEGGPLPTLLQQIWVPVVEQNTCNAAYSGRITDGMLCAGYSGGGQDACRGDSGGPYVVNGKLVGVISGGPSVVNGNVVGIVSWSRGCARPGFPGIYARVPVYRDWIRANTGV